MDVGLRPCFTHLSVSQQLSPGVTHAGARTSRTPAKSTASSLRRPSCGARARCRACRRRPAPRAATQEKQPASSPRFQRARAWAELEVCCEQLQQLGVGGCRSLHQLPHLARPLQVVHGQWYQGKTISAACSQVELLRRNKGMQLCLKYRHVHKLGIARPCVQTDVLCRLICCCNSCSNCCKLAQKCVPGG